MKAYSNKFAIVNKSSFHAESVRLVDTDVRAGAAAGETRLIESGLPTLSPRALNDEAALQWTGGAGTPIVTTKHPRKRLWSFRMPDGREVGATVHLWNRIGEQVVYLSLFDVGAPPLTDWMGGLPDTALLSELNVPGTNQSASYTVYDAMHQHQHEDFDIARQLASGIRYLHLDVQVDNKDFVLVYGKEHVAVPFSDVLTTIRTFLHAHPRETVMLLLHSPSEEKNEETDVNAFVQVFEQYRKAAPELWSVGNSIPKLGDVRGRIVLLRGFYNSPSMDVFPLGLRADNWPEDSTGFTCDLENTAPPQSVYLQNLYNIHYPWNVENKAATARQALAISVNLDRNRLYIDYFAAAGVNEHSDGGDPRSFTPYDMAEGIIFDDMIQLGAVGSPPAALMYEGLNQLLERDLDQRIDDHAESGIPHAVFVLDYANEALATKIVQLNFLTAPGGAR